MSAELWAKAFLAAQREMPAIHKNQKAVIPTKAGGSYSYTYADLKDIIDLALPVLHKHGLSVSQDPVTLNNQIGVATRIYHESGHVESFGPLLLPGGQDARSAGSAVTYARRYALTAALGIAVEDDDDGARAPAPETPPESDISHITDAKKLVLTLADGDKIRARELWEWALDDHGWDEADVTTEEIGSLINAVKRAIDNEGKGKK